MYYLTASYCGAWEPWDEYFTGSDVIGLNGGYGFSSPWYVKPDVNFVQQVFSYEDFEEYNTGSDLNGLNRGSGFLGFLPPDGIIIPNLNGLSQSVGFSTAWFVKLDTNWQSQVMSYENYEEYVTGSDLNGLSGSYGFASPWHVAFTFDSGSTFTPQIFDYEDFESYNTGSDLNRLSGGLGFQGNWYVNVDTNIRPSISSYEDFEEYDTGSNLNGLNEGAGFSSSWFMAPSF